MRPLLVSSGEPAGIGPDICLALAGLNMPVVVLGDKTVLAARAQQLNLPIQLIDYHPSHISMPQSSTSLRVLSLPCKVPVVAGVLDVGNVDYVISMLTYAVKACLQGEFSALITAPIHKAIINQAGIAFTGHTEFLASYCHIDTVVMMLVCKAMRVALVTTHLPLCEVAATITSSLIIKVVQQVHHALQVDFGIMKPRILVAGLNPHAGEEGYLGSEEIEIIMPALYDVQKQGLDVEGPLPADTLFTSGHLHGTDAFVTMFHDQGLPVLKYAGFGEAVNITLGLPIIRTSVDHGTALKLAGTGQADARSLIAAVNQAVCMVTQRNNYYA